MWAYIVNGVVQEITDIDPEGRYHESMLWVPCGPEVGERWLYKDGVFSPPPPFIDIVAPGEEPPADVPPTEQP